MDLPRGYHPKANAGIRGVSRCDGCHAPSLHEHASCPQFQLLRDAFMISWVRSPYSLKHAPGHDDRRSLKWAEDNLSRLTEWGRLLGCDGNAHYREAVAEYRKSMDPER